MNLVKPLRVQASMAKKSAATITSCCLARNSFPVVFRSRSGAGSSPCSFKILAMVPRDLMAQVGQGSLDSPVAPSPILGGHTHHQLLDLVLRTRTAGATLLAAIVLLADQPAVPSHERCRGHNRGQLMQHAPAQLLGPHGQAPALIVVEA